MVQSGQPTEENTLLTTSMHLLWFHLQRWK
uniref:Uncharacterized protein n=1 Tax=Rhizophora mucronata TaxID=61149 RepID=A0A2P2Q6A9_RHIMU